MLRCGRLSAKIKQQSQRAHLTLHLFNTLSGSVEPLAPSDGQTLRMYACGPTVYDYGHIGNFRTFIHVDVLRRTLKLAGIHIRHVMNITDVDDKIIRNAAAAGIPIADGIHPQDSRRRSLEDHGLIRQIERPEILARATEHIPADDVSLVERTCRSRTRLTRQRMAVVVFSACIAFRSTASSRKKDSRGH